MVKYQNMTLFVHINHFVFPTVGIMLYSTLVYTLQPAAKKSRIFLGLSL